MSQLMLQMLSPLIQIAIAILICLYSCSNPLSQTAEPVKSTRDLEHLRTERGPMQNETLFTIRWLAGIRLRNGKTNTIVREAADSVVFTVAESALNGTPPEAEANAGVAELDLGSGLHLCLLLFKAVPNPSAKLLNLYGQLNGNWIVAGASNTEPVNRLVPQNSIPLDQQAKTELLETSFIDWNGEEYQYEVFSQFEVLPRGAAALTTSKPLQFKPVGEAQKCIGNYPKVVINHMNDIQSKPLSQQ